MSNQIETTITVQLDNRDRKSVLLRIFLVVPIAIFVSAFTAWSGSSEASTFLSGLLFLPVLLALVFRGIYPSYALAFNKSLLALSKTIRIMCLPFCGVISARWSLFLLGKIASPRKPSSSIPLLGISRALG